MAHEFPNSHPNHVIWRQSNDISNKIQFSNSKHPIDNTKTRVINLGDRDCKASAISPHMIHSRLSISTPFSLFKEFHQKEKY